MYVKVLTSKSLDFLYLQAGYYRGFSVARLLHRIRICLSLTFPFLGQFMFLILQIHCRYIFFWGFLFILVIASTYIYYTTICKKINNSQKYSLLLWSFSYTKEVFEFFCHCVCYICIYAFFRAQSIFHF